MSYLKFDKDLIVNLEYSLYRNILRTNRRGAYQNNSISGCNTSRYQGLLVMPVPFIDNNNHLILSSFDEVVIQHGAEFNLGIHKYAGNNYSPKGHKYIREFECDSIPKVVYRVGGVVLSKETLFSSKLNCLMIKYKLLDAHSETKLRFKPFLAFRNIYKLAQENNTVNKSYEEIENGISTCLYYGYPNLYMQFNKKPQFIYEPHWNKDIEYMEDMELGYPYKEDMYVPGYFELDIATGEEIIFSASDTSISTEGLLQEFEEEKNNRTPRSSFYNCLRNSAHQFYYTPKDGDSYILAGFPWFNVRARDLFISLPGSTISSDYIDDFEKIFDSALVHINNFILGNYSESIIKEMDAPDVLLWAIWALQQYRKEREDRFMEKYASTVFAITNYIKSNNHPNLKLDKEDNLLFTYGRSKAVSWMNSMLNNSPVIPRSGYLVEINALWYNAVMFTQELCDMMGKDDSNDQFQKLGASIKESFVNKFMNEAGYLFDYIDNDSGNRDLRPNMIFAVSLDHSPLEKSQQKSVVDFVTKELLTIKGIRSLTPKSDKFRPYHSGNYEEREYSYFNGMAFPWLFGAYTEAYLKVFGKAALSLLDRIMSELEDEMHNNCVSTLSEFYDSSPPFQGHGGYSFAMSVSEVLRAIQIIDSYKNKL